MKNRQACGFYEPPDEAIPNVIQTFFREVWSKASRSEKTAIYERFGVTTRARNKWENGESTPTPENLRIMWELILESRGKR